MLSTLARMNDGGVVAIQLGSWLIFGIICAMIAANRGRSAVGWFFIGVFLSCIGLILVLCLPDLKKAEERERRQRLENRRLREQLAKERQVSDSRHHTVERRLGAHDEALGLDTATPPELTHSAAAAQLTGGTQWFYARDNERQGPVSAETIRHLLQAKAIDADTLIWSEGMSDWTAVRETEEFGGDLA
ncbi:MAG: DUF4339 domain-containing protein [Planctomycetes bacterium]|nr:DUF4339 domain-containing protein [Planctomycetota bacterium]